MNITKKGDLNICFSSISYFANDCICGETAKLTGDLIQSYIDSNLDYECEECERDIDPSFGWYPITIDQYIED